MDKYPAEAVRALTVRNCGLVIAAIVCLSSTAIGKGSAQSSPDEAIRTVCVSIDMSGLPERADLRNAFLSGFRRPFRLDTLLVERSSGYRRWVDAGRIVNRVRLSPEACPRRGPDPKGRTCIPVFGDPRDSTGPPELGVAVRLGGWSTLVIDYVYPKGSYPAPESLPPDRQLLDVWVAVCAPDSARLPLDSMWSSMVVNWGERPASDHRAEEIHGWLVGMVALQAVSRRVGHLPDSLDLVFESRGRNR